jgi:GT2 family glycosyltransferase
MNHKVWVIIPVHNRKALTRDCLQSLAKQSYSHHSVIVIDDGSTDDTEEMMKREFPDICLLKGDGNLFWTRSVNQGVEEALKRAEQKDYILTLNNDVIFESDYLEKLVLAARKSPKSLVGSVVIDERDNSSVIDGGIRIHWFTAKFEKLMSGINYQELLRGKNVLPQVDALSGRGALIPAQVFLEHGLFNARLLPHYAADYEFSIRAKSKGYSLFMNYEAVLIHRDEQGGYKRASYSWRHLLESFTSIRSPNNLYYRWNFARLCCPWYWLVFFYLLDVIRVFWGELRNQIFNRPVK